MVAPFFCRLVLSPLSIRTTCEQVLTLRSEGKTLKQISLVVGITHQAVSYRIKTASDRARVRSRLQNELEGCDPLTGVQSI